MDLNLTAEELQFPDELRAWLAAHVPKNWEHQHDESIDAQSRLSNSGSERCMTEAGPEFPGPPRTAAAARA